MSWYSALSIPLTEMGDISASGKIRWNVGKGTPYIPSPLLFDASPAIAGMQLFLRGAKFLYCVEQSE